MSEADEIKFLREKLAEAQLEIARRDYAIVLAKGKLSGNDFHSTIDEMDQALGLSKEALEVLGVTV